MLCAEMTLARHYLQKDKVTTIYIGGGTPSLLSVAEIAIIFNALHKNFDLIHCTEITIEANPDDLDKEKLKILRSFGINRLSIGIQTFNDQFLKYINRIHNAQEGKDCIKHAQKAGFENISIDMIYGIPYPDHSIWEQDLQYLQDLQLQHISSYCLTIENGTVFGNWRKQGKIKAAEDEFAAAQYEKLLEKLTLNGFEQYEISNYSLPEYHSIHNSSYWKGEKYLGLGPGAHSFNGYSRQNNIANNKKYIHAIENGIIPSLVEPLNIEDRINDYLMTSLRTKWGCSIQKLTTEYQLELKPLMKKVNAMESHGLVSLNNDILKLTPKGMLLADEISGRLFV
jgi:oxygen-independent coproporphyrinogen-3 oxidase